MGTVVSVNVAAMREVQRRGRLVRTGIWKLPVDGRVTVSGVSVDGDQQGDPRVHGGADKAVYAYARDDYRWWEEQLGRPLADGTFGENLTVDGIDVTRALVGERWQAGSVVLEVSEPRIPCWKLGRRIEDPRFVKRFARALRPGAYLRVIEAGEVGSGDGVTVLSRPGHGITVQLVACAYLSDHGLAPLLLEAGELSDGWRQWARQTAAAT